MPRQNTEGESKVCKIIERVLVKEIATKPEIKDLCVNVKLTPFEAGDKMPKILIVTVDKEIIRFVKANYQSYLNMMKKEFPGNIILTVRDVRIPQKKGLTLNRLREVVLQDLCFPAVIKGRVQEVEDRENVIEIVYLDAKQSYWNETAMKSLEKLACEMLKDKYSFALFAN